YNNSFWSLYVFAIWNALTVNIAIFLFIMLFANIDVLIRGIMVAVTILETLTISGMCLTASAVNKKARILYKSLNSLNLQLQNASNLNILVRAKVFCNFYPIDGVNQNLFSS